MFDLFGSIKSLLKVKTDSVCTDNNIFRLHSKFTVLLLVAFSLLVTSKQYMGNPIDCSSDTHLRPELIDSFCWINSTYTVKKKGVPRCNVGHPGVQQTEEGDLIKYHKYYQWVCFVLFLQAILFYTPRYLWKTWEGGKIKNLLMNLNTPFIEEEIKRAKIKLIVNYFFLNMGNQKLYSFSFFFCEVLNFFNVAGQFYFMDLFLGNQFINYGLRVLNYTTPELECLTPMDDIFPKVTKCKWVQHGSGADPNTYHLICVLSLNIINEKIYIFLWFWFIIVGLISSLGLVYRLATILLSPLRLYLLKARARFTAADHFHYNIINRHCGVADWFVLYQLGNNMDPFIYAELITELYEKYEGTEVRTLLVILSEKRFKCIRFLCGLRERVTTTVSEDSRHSRDRSSAKNC